MNGMSDLITLKATTNDGSYEYTISNNEVTIVKYLGTNADVTIPEAIEGYPVTTLGSSSFITNLTLERIELSAVVRIEARAFAGCTSLITVTGNYVTNIGAYAFYNCKALTAISIANVKALGQYCFANCIALERIEVPFIQEMPSNVLSKCYGLKDTTLSSVKTIGAYAFEKCEALSYIDTPEATAIEDAAFCYSGMTSADFPRVGYANDEAFLNCQSLQAINLPSIATLGDHVFMDSDAQCVCLSKELAQIGEEVFTRTEIKGLTIDYGTAAIDSVTEEDWYTFADTLTGLDVESIVGRYIKNNVAYTSFAKGDTEAPVITLNGESTMTLEVGLSKYIELGATVTDNSCETIEPVVSGSVDTSRIGRYSITYNATDSLGNQGIPVSRTVDVVDTTAPVITLNGANPMTLEVGVSNYSELGASVTDNSGESIQPVISGTVDTKKIKAYTITYTATDASGNKAVATRTVNVVDTTAPVITLKGDTVMTLEVGLSTYNEPGATVTDNSGELITPVITSQLNLYKIGQYVIAYNATDSSGNHALPVNRIINVVDTTIPVITLNGANPMNVEVGSPSYIDPGVTVKDNSGEVIQAVISGVVDTYKMGGYTLTYNATDSSGNRAVPVSRRVNVVDTTGPVITLNGANPMNLEVGITVYSEPGATVKDNSGESINPTISGSVNTKKIGKYAITYTATDSSGNRSQVIRNVNVVDTIPPLVTLNGANPMNIEIGLARYNEPGASAYDYSGETIYTVISGEVDNYKIGQYIITYTATDSSGNKTVVKRTVNVIDTTGPVITLVWPNPYYVTVNKAYQDPGASVNDNSGETIKPIVSGSVNVGVLGDYQLTYNATDSSGNHAIPVTRTVKVVKNNVIKCAQIVADNGTTGNVVRWALISVIDGTALYTSGDCQVMQSCKIDCSVLSLLVGTQFRLKAIVVGDADEKTDEIIQYEPDGNLIATFYIEAHHIDLISLEEYNYKCLYVGIYNVAVAVAKFVFYTLDDVKVYETDYVSEDDRIVDLRKLGIPVGTQLKIMANVAAGYDRWAPNIVQYAADPDMHEYGWFKFKGNLVENMFIFLGETDPTVPIV